MTAAQNRSRERPLIMVIDDNPDLLELFHDVLEDECDYVVNPHPDKPPTIEEIRDIRPDVLIIDHRLADGVRGWDIVREVRKTNDLYLLPILFCTADRQQVERVSDDLHELNVTPLVKPFSIDQLVGDVARALHLQGIDPTPCS